MLWFFVVVFSFSNLVYACSLATAHSQANSLVPKCFGIRNFRYVCQDQELQISVLGFGTSNMCFRIWICKYVFQYPEPQIRILGFGTTNTCFRIRKYIARFIVMNSTIHRYIKNTIRPTLIGHIMNNKFTLTQYRKFESLSYFSSMSNFVLEIYEINNIFFVVLFISKLCKCVL